MARIEIARLRKEHGMSQSELAQQLQITQSFLSAIENGKSPLPPEKEQRLHEIFAKSDLKDYTLDATGGNSSKALAAMSDMDLFHQLVTRISQQSQNKDVSKTMRDRCTQLEEQNHALLQRNDRLMERNEKVDMKLDALRGEIDALRNEVFRLKSILLSHNINPNQIS